MRYPKKGDRVRWRSEDQTMCKLTGVKMAPNARVIAVWDLDWTPAQFEEGLHIYSVTVKEIKLYGVIQTPPGPCWDPYYYGQWFILDEPDENEFGVVSP